MVVTVATRTDSRLREESGGMPLKSHVTSALHSGDMSKEETDEIVLQFSAYYGLAKGEALSDTAHAAWATMPAPAVSES
jgi:hypothetical protein